MSKSKPQLRIVPLGGLGEVGKNMTVFELGNDAFIIDTGIMFPTNDMYGVDYIIPDFSYLMQRTDLKIHGIVYTHGHEDHTGAVAHVAAAMPNVPIYATPLTAGLINNKLRRAELAERIKVNIFNPGDTLQVGPFKLESFHVCHSIPDGVGFGIHTPYGLIVHSGDYKFDNTPVDGQPPDYAKLAQFSKEGVLLLMSDSTNADKPGWTPSETVIDAGFDRVFRKAPGRIIVATFASLLSRVQQVLNAAQNHGRKVAIAGHSMTENVKIARELGIIKAPDTLFIDIGLVNHMPAQKVVIMATGSQGEPSAVLARMSTGRHRQLDVEKGDTIIVSAHPIPGNEESVYRTINRLFQRGAQVIYDPIEAVHVSGHARQDEMRLLMNLTRPKYFLPIHGELRHLQEHANLAVRSGIPKDNVFIIENGNVIEISSRGVKIGERVPGGYVFVDGASVGDIGPAVIRDRETLARDGFFLVSVTVDRQGKLIGEPEFVSRGFVYLKEAESLMEIAKEAVMRVMGDSMLQRNGNREDVLRDSLRRVLYNETKRRPLVFSIINER